MIKRATAIFFVLLANIILLVYAVVPHHHHHEQICIENSHCQDDESTHKHDTPGHDHEHDGSTGADCCVLRQALVVPPNSLRQEINCPGDEDKDPPFQDYTAQLVPIDPISMAPENIPKVQFSPGTFTASIFLSSSSGLRAPPAV